MKKVCVGVDRLKQDQYRLSLEVKQKAFNDALSYASTFIKVKDFKAFQSDMCAYFQTEFMTAYASDFSKLLTYDKICELSGVELHKLKAIQAQFDSVDIELHPLTLKPLHEPDFNEYISDERLIKNFEQSQFLLDKLNEIEAKGIEIKPVLLQQAFRGLLLFNWSDNRLTPNYNR